MPDNPRSEVPTRPSVTLRFLGAAGTVTGSKHLLTIGQRRVLLDCGLFQGLKPLRLRNWAEPPHGLSEVEAVVLSHAHIDHSGYLPLLAKRGFSGPIFCTPGTADLLKILLPDSGHLQEEDAERANRYSYSKHHPALPLYTMEDAINVLRLIQPRDYHQPFDAIGGVQTLFRPAGHILGAATVDLNLRDANLRLVFSGDLGRFHHPFLLPPEPVAAADILLLESTYGDRTHDPDAIQGVARVVQEAAKKGGALVVPAFAVGRTQELLWILRRLEDQELIPVLPVYVDSPMAIDVTELTSRHPEDLSIDSALLRHPEQNPLRPKNMTFTHEVGESKAINDVRGPCIIISASGMATGGRVLHHLKLRLPDERTTVLLPGFQAVGTRGRQLQEGATEVKIHGQMIPVRARVETVNGLSAHADREELLQWLGSFKNPPRQTYLVHGEPSQSSALAKTIGERLKWKVQPAEDGEVVVLA